MNRIGRAMGLGVLLSAAPGAFAGCGDDDEKGSTGGSFENIASAIESPTGTVDESTAGDIGVEFDKVANVNVAGGMRRDAQTAQSGTGSMACPAGGSVNISASGGMQSGQATATYDGCCSTADCCLDGRSDTYYSTEQGAQFAFCASYDWSYDCDGTSAALSFEGCFSTTGQQVYVIEVDGDTYAVSGSYSSGSGTLEIRGENGTWTCTYSGSTGNCSGSGGSSFTF